MQSLIGGAGPIVQDALGVAQSNPSYMNIGNPAAPPPKWSGAPAKGFGPWSGNGISPPLGLMPETAALLAKQIQYFADNAARMTQLQQQNAAAEAQRQADAAAAAAAPAPVVPYDGPLDFLGRPYYPDSNGGG